MQLGRAGRIGRAAATSARSAQRVARRSCGIKWWSTACAGQASCRSTFAVFAPGPAGAPVALYELAGNEGAAISRRQP
jgi:hypothetical protein